MRGGAGIQKMRLSRKQSHSSEAVTEEERWRIDEHGEGIRVRDVGKAITNQITSTKKLKVDEIWVLPASKTHI
jgi:hypothetical protein